MGYSLVRSFIEKTQDHFNIFKTRPNTSYSFIAESLIKTLSSFEIEEFLGKLKSTMVDLYPVNDDYTEFEECISPKFNVVLYELAKYLSIDENKKEAISRWIINEYEANQNELVVQFPEVCRYVKFPEKNIRQIWMRFTFKSSAQINSLQELLNYIPENEFNELADKLIRLNPDVILQMKPIMGKINERFKSIFLDQYLQFLKSKVVITRSEFKFANPRKNALEEFLSLNYKIDELFEGFYNLICDPFRAPAKILEVINSFLRENSNIEREFLDMYPNIFFNNETERYKVTRDE